LSGAGGGNVRKKLKDGTEVKSSVTLGCATLIYSVMAPEQGGETLFAHGGVLYDLLPEELQHKALAATVRYRGRSGKLEDAVMGEGGTKIIDDDKITTRLPLVRSHPTTGRKCIWATPRFMESVEGLSVEESRELVSRCMQPGTAPGHVYVHKYSVGDVVVWDDRHCFHSTSPIKEKEERYGTGGVVGRRVIQRVGSSTAAAYKWGSTCSRQQHYMEYL
jgi:alpha-ketoglutarate-dependent taurine dioxygenase